MRADLVTVAALERSDDDSDALQMLFVDEGCTYWVVDTALSDDVRTGVLDPVEAGELWMDLGTDAREGLPREEGTSSVGPVWIIEDSTDQLLCIGECVSERVDSGVDRVFELADQWAQALHARGTTFEGSLDDIGLPDDQQLFESGGQPMVDTEER